MKYKCIACDYLTNDRRNWHSHINTKKHMKHDETNVTKDNIDKMMDEKINAMNDKLNIFMDDVKNFIKTNVIGSVKNTPNDSLSSKTKSYVCPNCKLECSKSYNLSHRMKKCVCAKNNIKIVDDDENVKLPDKAETHIPRKQKPSETADVVNNDKSLACQYCGLICKRSCNLIQHMNKCAKHKDLEKENKTLAENNKSLNTLVKKSMGTFKYVNSHYPDAPNIAKLTHNQMNQLLLDNVSHGEIVDALILKYEFNKLDTFLGDLIVESYKTKDPSEQTLWSSDVVRLSYVVKTLINEQSKWIMDKKGVHVLEHVIQPLLTYIEKNYLAKCQTELYEREDHSEIGMKK